MASSNAIRRAIAIRNNIAKRVAATAVASNDNQPVRARRQRATLTDACVASAGFAEHAGY